MEKVNQLLAFPSSCEVTVNEEFKNWYYNDFLK